MSSSLRNLRWSVLSMIALMLSELIINFFLSRTLSPVEYGLYSKLLLIKNFCIIFIDLGLTQYIFSLGEIENDHFSTLYWLNLFSGFLVFVFLLLFAETISFSFSMMLILGLNFLFIPISQLYYKILQKRQNFIELFIIDLVYSISFLVITLLFMTIYSKSYEGYIFGLAFANLMKFLLCHFFGFRITKISFFFKKKFLKNFYNFGVFQLFEKISTYLFLNIDKLLILSLLGNEQLGYYNFAYQLIIMPVNIINPIFIKITLPLFSQNRDNAIDLRKIYLKTINIISSINFPIYSAVFIFTPNIIPILFGVQWNSTYNLIRILCFVGMTMTIGNPVGALMVSKSIVRKPFYWNLFAFIIRILLIFSVISFFSLSIFGVSITILILQCFFVYLSFLYLIKNTLDNIKFKEYLHSFSPNLIQNLITILVVILFQNIIIQILLFLGILLISTWKFNPIVFSFLKQMIIPNQINSNKDYFE